MINLNPMAGIAKELMGGLDALFTLMKSGPKLNCYSMTGYSSPIFVQALANIEESKHPSVFVSRLASLHSAGSVC